MLTLLLQRARTLSQQGEELFATPDFSRFLKNTFSLIDFKMQSDLLGSFNGLDDNDVWASVKGWTVHKDPVLPAPETQILHSSYKTKPF